MTAKSIEWMKNDWKIQKFPILFSHASRIIDIFVIISVHSCFMPYVRQGKLFELENNGYDSTFKDHCHSIHTSYRAKSTIAITL